MIQRLCPVSSSSARPELQQLALDVAGADLRSGLVSEGRGSPLRKPRVCIGVPPGRQCALVYLSLELGQMPVNVRCQRSLGWPLRLELFARFLPPDLNVRGVGSWRERLRLLLTIDLHRRYQAIPPNDHTLQPISPGISWLNIVRFAAFSGWRRHEIQQLRWDEVDLPGGVIRLSPERSKNSEARVLPIVGPIKEVIERRAALERPPDFLYVFWRTTGGKVRGHRETPVRYLPIQQWRTQWKQATKDAGCPSALMHDLRRTVVRNLTRAGVPEKVSMGWTGHKTRSVFDRYNIVDEADLHVAGAKLAAHIDGGGK